ncbi:hypothetical protein ACO0RG_003484 [Hanseniaspora osmophila]|uniref:ER membrane protein complex subunit 10 n=1 Tax=Hanseniaspora osmophila TaxID=56408 RepID=A0A1E5RFR2_9ASCO|nr:hypothetical protein AWRI3579_g2123 [Hanseniaspora osmophila]
MKLSALIYASLAGFQVVSASSMLITARNVQSQEEHSFFELYKDDESGKYTVENLNAELPVGSNELYCFTASGDIGGLENNKDCFTVAKLVSPLSYDLFIDEDVGRLTLKYSNKSLNEITPITRSAVQGFSAGLTKLKKVTKQYPKNQKNVKNPYEQEGVIEDKAIEAEKEVEDEKQLTFFEKNWRFMIAGLLIYSVLFRKSGPKPAKPE